MMNRDEELKDYFQSRPPQEEFSFDPGTWEKMHAVLLAERKTRRRRFIIYLNLLILLIGIGVLYTLRDADRPSATLSHSRAAQKIILDEKPALVIQNKKHASVSSGEANANRSYSKLTSLPHPKNSDLAVKSGDAELSPANTFAHTRFTAGKVEIALIRVFNKQSTKTEDHDLADIETKESQPLFFENQSHDITQTPATRQETSANEHRNTPAKIASEKLPPEYVDLLTAKTIQLAGRPDSLPIFTFQLTPELNAAMPRVQEDSLRKRLNPEKKLAFVIGADYLLGWKNAGQTEANGFNPVVGCDYNNTISNRTSLSVGLQYTTINHLTNTDHTSSATRIKFGEEVDVTTISARKLYYLLMPLKLHYTFRRKNSLGIGYTVGYLLDVKSQVKTYTERQGMQTNPQTSTTMGYSKGFSNFDGQLALCYQRTLFKNVSAAAEFFYGTKDLKLNTIYNSNAFERNTGFKLTLNYIFLKK